jgi:hypothetical protein
MFIEECRDENKPQTSSVNKKYGSCSPRVKILLGFSLYIYRQRKILRVPNLLLKMNIYIYIYIYKLHIRQRRRRTKKENE